LTFEEAFEQISADDCGRSRVPAKDRTKFMAERLGRQIANWRCGALADVAAAATTGRHFRPQAFVPD
jgi:hypothetical protein